MIQRKFFTFLLILAQKFHSDAHPKSLLKNIAGQVNISHGHPDTLRTIHESKTIADIESDSCLLDCSILDVIFSD
jgi:hypothetical protein